MKAIPRALGRLLFFVLAVEFAALGWRQATSHNLATGQIIGGSMAPTLLGRPHYRLNCGDCGYAFACDADNPPDRGLAVCPNCGYAENEVGPTQLAAGEAVVIDRSAFAYRGPRRWDVAALRDVDDEHPFTVKRIVGLPGETVSIRQGDLYIDGHLVRKSLADLKRLAVSVHDDRFRPSQLPPRWHAESAGSRWQAARGGYDCRATGDFVKFDWLTYRHWSCMSSPLARTRESEVLDNDSYNQGASRNLQTVRDLLLALRIQAQGDGLVSLRMHDGREWFIVELWPQRNLAVLKREGIELTRAGLQPRVFQKEGATVELALCDRQVLLAIAGEPVIVRPYAASGGPVVPTTRPIGLGAWSVDLKVSELVVSRDIYYLDPLNTGQSWSLDRRLAANEFFVLGDNVPISRDSRVWPAGSVSRSSLLGSVLAKRSKPAHR